METRTATLRVRKSTHQALKTLARQSGLPMQEVLARALEEYGRKSFLEGLASDFAALRADPEAWSCEQEERAVWDATLADGLSDA
jgi:hypothetical protein